jgi:hypothetical protein
MMQIDYKAVTHAQDPMIGRKQHQIYRGEEEKKTKPEMFSLSKRSRSEKLSYEVDFPRLCIHP